ncbi:MULTISPECIES: hypothetical protein [unclassified Streptomyces]|uniref:hypothetical protein n=1 Tax=Streptomyces sp. NPDC127532 TaxID=3345399 RepID=UPI00362AA66C
MESEPVPAEIIGTQVLDAVHLEPGADVADVTTLQIREVVERLVAVGQWRPGDPKVLHRWASVRPRTRSWS